MNQPVTQVARTANHVPLAQRLRPKTLGDVIGQDHLLGEGLPLRLAFESGQPHSCILWGPPGVGKTTIARLMADAFDAQFLSISAVLGGVKEIREVIHVLIVSWRRFENHILFDRSFTLCFCPFRVVITRHFFLHTFRKCKHGIASTET